MFRKSFWRNVKNRRFEKSPDALLLWPVERYGRLFLVARGRTGSRPRNRRDEANIAKRKVRYMSQVLWNARPLTVFVDGEVNARTIDSLIPKGEIPASMSEITLDMSDVRLVKPAGICHLLCFLAWLSGQSRSFLPVRVIQPPEAVASYLATLGFFSALRSITRLIGCENLIRLEQDRRNRRLERLRGRTVGIHRQTRPPRPVVLPIEVILQRSPTETTDSFESNCMGFVSRAADTFEQLFESQLGVAFANVRQFWQANVELYKNIYEHSQSWGLATIVARPGHGTVVSYHDIGVGIRGSLNASQAVQPKFATDGEAIRWALQEGHTSKQGNSGLGLSLVTGYVQAAVGTIEIRSGGCRLFRSGPASEWVAQEVSAVVGTHVSFHLPVAV
jgi:hypothetical protein